MKITPEHKAYLHEQFVEGVARMGVANLLALHDTHIFVSGVRNVTNKIGWSMFLWCVPLESQTYFMSLYSDAAIRNLSVKILKELVKPNEL